MTDLLILTLMLSGLAAIAAALWMAWPPLAVGFVGVLLVAIAVAAYVRARKAKRG